MTPPQGMSAEQVFQAQLGDLARQGEHQRELVLWLGTSHKDSIAAARADERKMVFKEVSTGDLTCAIQEQMEFKDQRDALIAAKPGERVKAHNVAIEAVCVMECTYCNNLGAPKLNAATGWWEHPTYGICEANKFRGLKLPEATPVERSE